MLQALLAPFTKGRRDAARRRAAALADDIDTHGPDADRLRALGDALEAAGDLLAAVDRLSEANRLRADVALERRLVRLRRKAFAALRRVAPAPPGTVPRAPVEREIAAADMTVERVRGAILTHGCVLVRGLVPEARIARLRDAIDRAFAAREEVLARRPPSAAGAWYDPVERVPKDASRTWVRAGQGLLAADSPRAFFELLETMREIGLDRLIAGYFQERPALSVEKCVLRRADAALHESTWHQDGAFLGTGIRTVDAWFALSACGRDAPGLDLVPVRLDRILPTGEPGTYFEWTVSADTIARELPGVPVWRPELEAGDVLLFDHMLLHRTAAERDMPNVRYAIESWFFAPSVYPKTSTPLVV